jgi:hypothetical protein
MILQSNLPHSHAVAGIFCIGVAKGCARRKQPVAGSSGVHKLTIDSAPKGAEAMINNKSIPRASAGLRLLAIFDHIRSYSSFIPFDYKNWGSTLCFIFLCHFCILKPEFCTKKHLLKIVIAES